MLFLCWNPRRLFVCFNYYYLALLILFLLKICIIKSIYYKIIYIIILGPIHSLQHVIWMQMPLSQHGPERAWSEIMVILILLLLNLYLCIFLIYNCYIFFIILIIFCWIYLFIYLFDSLWRFYTQAVGGQSLGNWNFSSWIPHAVVINLGIFLLFYLLSFIFFFLFLYFYFLLEF